MSLDPYRERIRQLRAVPPELLVYERWLEGERRARRGPRDYLFADERPRFEPRREDVVVALDGVTVREHRGRARLVVGNAAIELGEVRARDAEKILAAVDGRRCLLEVRWQAGVEPEVLARFLRAAFGRVVLAPRAVEALEQRLPGSEIVRFPTVPYAIERSYWNNMIEVRARFSERWASSSRDDFVDLLCELHVIALCGARLDSFYKPASPIADELVAPGALYLSEPRLMEAASGIIFLSGPRVKVPLFGGETYQRLLCRSLGDEAALDGERRFEEAGLSWGRLVLARSERDPEPVAMFCPPRPIEPGHFEHLHAELSRAADPDHAVGAAARFHQAFVRLHPFHCANQSLAMNLVNARLSNSRGAGIPHLLLDHFALRLSTPAYEELFARAVNAFAIADPDPARRLATLLERKRRSQALIEELARDPRAGGRDEEAAAWALLADQ